MSPSQLSLDLNEVEFAPASSQDASTQLDSSEVEFAPNAKLQADTDLGKLAQGPGAQTTSPGPLKTLGSSFAKPAPLATGEILANEANPQSRFKQQEERQPGTSPLASKTTRMAQPGARQPLPGDLTTKPAEYDRDEVEFEYNYGLGAGPLADSMKTVGGAIADPAIQTYEGGKQIAQAADTNSDTNPNYKRDLMQGMTKMVTGGGKLAIAAGAPELIELGAAAGAGDAAAQLGLLKFLGGLEAGNVSGEIADHATKSLGFSQDAQDLTTTISFFLPTLAGMAMGLHTKAGMIKEDLGGGTGVEAQAFGGKVQAGVGATPQAFGAGIKVGDTSISARVPRPGQKSQLPDPGTQAAAADVNDAAAALVRKAQTEKAASDAAAGIPPPPPPQPPMPSEMQNAHLSPQIIGDVTKLISMAPGSERTKMMMEAHEKLSGWMLNQGRFVGPDGKMVVVDSPKAAQSAASKVINDAVDAHEAQQQEAQKQQAEVQKQQEKAQAETQKAQEAQAKEKADREAKGEPDPMLARATTILDSHPNPSVSVLQRQMGIGFGQALDLMKQYQQAQIPKVGAKGEQVVEESKATVDEQVKALTAGNINVVMLPEGSKYRPQVPEGMQMMSVTGDQPGAGIYIYNPKAIRAQTIKAAVKAGTHGDLLGHVQTKEEVAAAPVTTVVQAHTADGTPIQDSAVDATQPDKVMAQVEALHERHPDAGISLKHPDLVQEERAKAAEPAAASEEEKQETSPAELGEDEVEKFEPPPRKLPPEMKGPFAVTRAKNPKEGFVVVDSEDNAWVGGINESSIRRQAAKLNNDWLDDERNHKSYAENYDSWNRMAKFADQHPIERTKEEVADIASGKLRPNEGVHAGSPIFDGDASRTRRTEMVNEVKHLWTKPYDKDLFRSISGTEGNTDSWDLLRRDGASDGQIHDLLTTLGHGAHSSDVPGIDWADHHGGANPYVKFGSGAKKETLKGKTLIAEVRRILDIGEPKAKGTTAKPYSVVDDGVSNSVEIHGPQGPLHIFRTSNFGTRENAVEAAHKEADHLNSGGHPWKKADIVPTRGGAVAVPHEPQLKEPAPNLNNGAAIKGTNPQKGDRVRFQDRDDNYHEGTVEHRNGVITRIRADDKKEYTVSNKKVHPAEIKDLPKEVEPASKEADNVIAPQESEDGSPTAPASDDHPGRGRETSDLGSEDQESLAETPAADVRGTEEERDAGEDSEPESPKLRDGAAPVREPRAEPGPRAGSGDGLDNAPAREPIDRANRELAKPVVRNKQWFSHPDNFSVDAGETVRLERNLAALELLKDLETNPHKLSDEEKATLASYIGWGALSHVFAPWRAPYEQRQKWTEANRKLEALLSEDELAAAKRSTQNAHYTSPEMVRFMWDAMRRMGFKAGTVLEPSMGTGNFFGMMPKSVRGKVIGLGNELDTTTFKIAQQLYPEAHITNLDFKDLILPDNSVDLAIGNVPFGEAIYDPKYPKLKARVHDYFFVKSLDKVKPGGILAYITSTGTLDKDNNNIRTILASKADMVAAFRLPSDTFAKNAGTQVTTDLIFLQKRAPGQAEGKQKWVDTVNRDVHRDKDMGHDSLAMNQYYAEHPEHMLGRPVSSKNMYGSYELVLRPYDDKPADLFAKALEKLPRGLLNETQATGVNRAETAAEFAPDHIKEGQFTLNDKGEVRQKVQGRLVKPEIILAADGSPVPGKVARMKGMIGVRDKLNALMADMATMPDDDKANGIIAKKRTELKKIYDAFAKQYGLLHSSANSSVFDEDPHYPRLLALENYDKATKKATPADIFTKRTIYPRAPLQYLSHEPKDAMFQVLGERGFVDVSLMAQLQDKSVEEVEKSLIDAGLVFKDPEKGALETKEKYLSGYVRDKLDAARAAVRQGKKEYQPNVDALEKAQPTDIPIADINVKLGGTWIPTTAIQDFASDVLKASAEIKFTSGQWSVPNMQKTAEITNLFGTKRMHADELLELSLNQKSALVKDRVEDKEYVNAEETAAARDKQDKLKKAFQEWAQGSPKWKAKLEKNYNYAFNNNVIPEYDGSHLTLPGKSPAITLRTHQVNSIWRGVQDGRVLLAHDVGAGKTFVMAAIAMESRRIGTAKKPLIAVPNHRVQGTATEFLQLYPGASLLVPSENDFTPKKRNRTMAKIATGDYDAIILPHSQFDLMDISAPRQLKTLNAMMDELEETLRSVKETEGAKSRTVKQIEKAKEKLRARMDKLRDLKADKTINFDETGIDQLHVDEAHEYKNLAFYTKLTRVAGLAQGDAKKAIRLKMKTDYLLDTYNQRGVIFATGTPISNTMAELRSMSVYVAPDTLEKAGLHYFDDWAANFGEIVPKMELSADGRTYTVRDKFAKFTNVPEMMQIFRSIADIKTAEDLNLPVPPFEGGKRNLVEVPPSDAVTSYIESLVKRGEAVKSGRVKPEDDNMLAINTDGRKAATDMRLIDYNLPDDPNSKINHAVKNIYKEWLEGKADKLTQLAFLDLYRYSENEAVPLKAGEKLGLMEQRKTKPVEKLNLYKDMIDKLAKAGVPRSEMAVAGDYQGNAKKEELFAKMRTGEIRILFGSTQKMGAGMNVQDKLKALHHIDLPYKPGEVTQREGRIRRQGNQNKEIRVFNYLTQRSFDTRMADILLGKAEFIQQVMSGKNKDRTMLDAAGDVVLSYEELKMAASGNPDVRRRFELGARITQLQQLERAHSAGERDLKYRAQTERMDLHHAEARLEAMQSVQEVIEGVTGGKNGEGFALEVDGKKFDDRKTAFDHLDAMDVPQGNFFLKFNGVGIAVDIATPLGVPTLQYILPYSNDKYSAPDRTMSSLGRSIEARLRGLTDAISATKNRVKFSGEKIDKLEATEKEGAKFEHADELRTALKELREVDKRLGIGKDTDKTDLGEMAEADTSAEDDGDESDGGTTMRASLFGLDIAAEFAAKQAVKFYHADVAPALKKLGMSAKEAGKSIAHTLYPRFGTNPDALDAMHSAKGDLEAHRFLLEQLEGGIEKFFAKLSKEQNYAFIDRMKLGVGQPSPELQHIEDIARAIDAQSLAMAQKYSPNLQAKENHYRVLWKVIPDPSGTHGNKKKGQQYNSGGRRPFEGDKGFMRRSTLDTISEGINYGGEPVTDNAWKMFTLAQLSIMKYITARSAWEKYGKLGFRKFIRGGATPPGFMDVPDKIAKVYFPAASGEGKIDAGRWVVQESAGRPLINYLSRDLIRENAIGNALLTAKNITTAIELGLSPFHFIFETIEAVGSQFGLGIQRALNSGIRLGDSGELKQGAKEMAAAVAAPVTLARAGGSLLKSAGNYQKFANTARGAAFLRAYPDAQRDLQILFKGGLQYNMNPDYKVDPVKSMREAAKEGNYVGAALRMVPAIASGIMHPLFEVYIPRLKLGFALAQLAQQRVEHAKALANGDITELTMARKVVDTVENRLGELNFSNLYWNNTFKSAMQFNFRSITWKLGNWRGATEAATAEMKGLLADPLQAAWDYAKGDRSHPREDFIPKLGMNQAWLLGMALTTAVIGTIVTYLLNGKFPWEYSEEDVAHGYNKATSMLLEMMHPRMGDVDAHGKPNRMTLPTGLKDFEHSVHDPAGYLRGSLSEITGKGLDTAQNRDFYGNYVYDPRAPAVQKFLQIARYNMPKPISISGLTDRRNKTWQQKARAFAGINGASKDLDLSSAEKNMRDYQRANHTPLTPQKQEELHQRDLRKEAGHLTHRELLYIMRTRHQDYMEKMFTGMPYLEAKKAYDLATAAEKAKLRPLLVKKRQNAIANGQRVAPQ